MFLRQQDENVDPLQSTLQEFSISLVETPSPPPSLFSTTKIGNAENENVQFSNIRTILEIFVLYSISTSDFRWIYDKRAAYIGRQTEVLSEIIYSPSKTLCPLNLVQVRIVFDWLRCERRYRAANTVAPVSSKILSNWQTACR